MAYILAVFYITISRFDFLTVSPSQEHRPSENQLRELQIKLSPRICFLAKMQTCFQSTLQT